MKLSACVSAAVLLATAASAHPAASTKHVSADNTTLAYPICQNPGTFAKADGRLFNFNGTGTKYFAGTNTWWLSHILSDSDVDTVLSEIKDVSTFSWLA